MPSRTKDGQRYRSREMTMYEKIFPPSRFETKPGCGGHMGDDFGNNYFFFEAGGMQFMVVGLEHRPREGAGVIDVFWWRRTGICSAMVRVIGLTTR